MVMNNFMRKSPSACGVTPGASSPKSPNTYRPIDQETYYYVETLIPLEKP